MCYTNKNTVLLFCMRYLCQWSLESQVVQYFNCKFQFTWWKSNTNNMEFILLFFWQKNIVHRDLKLGNMVLNKRTRRITITNFCLGKHLVSDRDLLKDQRGSPAYISPDVLSGQWCVTMRAGVLCLFLINRTCFFRLKVNYRFQSAMSNTELVLPDPA